MSRSKKKKKNNNNTDSMVTNSIKPFKMAHIKKKKILEDIMLAVKETPDW